MIATAAFWRAHSMMRGISTRNHLPTTAATICIKIINGITRVIHPDYLHFWV
jgi:hypothetical protein